MLETVRMHGHLPIKIIGILARISGLNVLLAPPDKTKGGGAIVR